MKSAYGINIPRTLEEVCDPQRIALLVYDMQVEISNPMLICITSPFTIATFRNVAPLQLDQEFLRVHGLFYRASAFAGSTPIRRKRSAKRGSERSARNMGWHAK